MSAFPLFSQGKFSTYSFLHRIRFCSWTALILFMSPMNLFCFIPLTCSSCTVHFCLLTPMRNTFTCPALVVHICQNAYDFKWYCTDSHLFTTTTFLLQHFFLFLEIYRRLDDNTPTLMSCLYHNHLSTKAVVSKLHPNCQWKILSIIIMAT